MNGEDFKKLEEIMVKCGAGKLKDGEIVSDKMREFIRKLHYHYVTFDRSQIRITKPKFMTEKVTTAPDTRMCPMADEEVSISDFCSRCHDKTPDTWRKCPAR